MKACTSLTDVGWWSNLLILPMLQTPHEADLQTFCICFCKVRFWSMMTPRSRTWSATSNSMAVANTESFNWNTVSKLRWNVNYFTFIIIQLQSVGCRPNLYILYRQSDSIKYFVSAIISDRNDTLICVLLSYIAYLTPSWVLIISVREDVYKTNSNGPTTEPWGTPKLMGNGTDDDNTLCSSLKIWSEPLKGCSCDVKVYF